MYEKEIEIRWRDMDAFGHVNNCVYLTYLEEARDEWMERVVGSAISGWDYVLARVAIDYVKQLRQEDDRATVRCALEKIGTSSLHLREEILARDRLVARAEAVLVAYDRKTGASRPLTEAERQVFTRELPRPHP